MPINFLRLFLYKGGSVSRLCATIYDAKNPPPEWMLRISGLMRVEMSRARVEMDTAQLIEIFYLCINSTYEEITQNARSRLCKCSFLPVSFLF